MSRKLLNLFLILSMMLVAVPVTLAAPEGARGRPGLRARGR